MILSLAQSILIWMRFEREDPGFQGASVISSNIKGYQREWSTSTAYLVIEHQAAPARHCCIACPISRAIDLPFPKGVRTRTTGHLHLSGFDGQDRLKVWNSECLAWWVGF